MSQDRKFARVDYEEHVELEIDGETSPGLTINISQGGVLLRTDIDVKFGMKLNLLMDIPGIKDTCTIPCVVRWVKQDEIGLQFELLRPLEVWAFGKLLK